MQDQAWAGLMGSIRKMEESLADVRAKTKGSMSLLRMKRLSMLWRFLLSGWIKEHQSTHDPKRGNSHFISIFIVPLS